jgi:hypothetical protein
MSGWGSLLLALAEACCAGSDLGLAIVLPDSLLAGVAFF